MCDINEKQVQRWRDGDLPFFEPDLEEHYLQATRQQNIVFTSQVIESIMESDLVYLCVNTPAKTYDKINYSSEHNLAYL